MMSQISMAHVAATRQISASLGLTHFIFIPDQFTAFPFSTLSLNHGYHGHPNIFGYNIDNMNQYDTIWYNWLIMHKSWRPKIHDCIRLHGLFIYSNSRTKVLRRPPSLTEEGSMVLLLHMWLNDFPAARDLIRAAKSHRCQLYIFDHICPPKRKSIIQNHRLQFISFMTMFFFLGGGQLHVAPIGLQGPVASNPRKTSEEMGSGPCQDPLISWGMLMTPGSTPLQFDCSLILNGSTSVLLPKCLVARSHFLFILFSFSGSGSKIPMCLFLGPTCPHCLLIEGQMGGQKLGPLVTIAIPSGKLT